MRRRTLGTLSVAVALALAALVPWSDERGRDNSSEPDPGIRALYLDRVNASNLAPGAPVTARAGYLIGTVSAVNDERTTVLLINDPASMVGATVETRGAPKGILRGEPGGGIILTMLPKDAVIASGDIVVTAGLETGIRRGIPIGSVGEVYRDEREPFASARVIPVGSLTP